jgi:hypothetical protein
MGNAEIGIKGWVMKIASKKKSRKRRCSQGSKPKTGPLMALKENFPKQRKYKYFTSQKVYSLDIFFPTSFVT